MSVYIIVAMRPRRWQVNSHSVQEWHSHFSIIYLWGSSVAFFARRPQYVLGFLIFQIFFLPLPWRFIILIWISEVRPSRRIPGFYIYPLICSYSRWSTATWNIERRIQDFMCSDTIYKSLIVLLRYYLLILFNRRISMLYGVRAFSG